MKTIDQIREAFEATVRETPQLRDNTPLGAMTFNGQFSHYMDQYTDTLWIGFQLGVRWQEREANKTAAEKSADRA